MVTSSKSKRMCYDQSHPLKFIICHRWLSGQAINPPPHFFLSARMRQMCVHSTGSHCAISQLYVHCLQVMVTRTKSKRRFAKCLLFCLPTHSEGDIYISIPIDQTPAYLHQRDLTLRLHQKLQSVYEKYSYTIIIKSQNPLKHLKVTKYSCKS